MCRALYAPMHALCLADQKTPAMDKLYFYILQTDAMLPKYLDSLESQTAGFLSETTIQSMASVPMAGESDSEEDDNSSGDDEDDDRGNNDDKKENDDDDEDEFDTQVME